MSDLKDIFGNEVNSQNLDQWLNISRKIVKDTSGKKGQEYFDSVTMKLNSIFGAEYSFIGSYDDKKADYVQTISFCNNSTIIDNILYDIKDSPNLNVINNGFKSYNSNIQKEFPDDQLLKDMNIESYIGFSLYDSDKKVNGVIALLFTHEIYDTRLAEMLINTFISKITYEIELGNSGKQVVQNIEEFSELFNNTPNSLWEQDLSAVKSVLDRLRFEDSKEYSDYFRQNPIILKELISKIDIKKINRETLKLFNATDINEFVERINDVFTIDSIDFSTNFILNLIKGETRGSEKLVAYTLDGKKLILEVNWILPTRYKDNWIKVYLSFVDLTERVDLESQLLQSEKMRAIGQLAGGIAHDFNNQLAGIVGYLDILKVELEDKPSHREYIDKIFRSVNRASDLTKQLLSFARKGKMLNIALNIHDIVKEVVSISKRTFDKRIKILLRLDAMRSWIVGDPNQIQNAIMNIAINGRDAMESGGNLTFVTENITVENDDNIHAKKEMHPGEYLLLSVSDQGTGIDSNVRNKIFEPFFTTKSVGKGTGMGLASVFGTLKDHRGYIDLQTEEGKGTTFKLFFPLTSNEKSIPELQSIKKTTKGHILIIDDEETILETVTILLEKRGFKVSSSSGGIGGLKVYEKERRNIDLVLLDMIMPDMSGEETFRELKNLNPEANIIISSGYSVDSTTQKLLDNGARGFIQKPYRMSELAKLIEKILKS